MYLDFKPKKWHKNRRFKKLFLLILVIFILGFVIPCLITEILAPNPLHQVNSTENFTGRSITFYAPVYNETWLKGNSYFIRWTGASGTYVNINLWHVNWNNPSNPFPYKIATIATAPNDGSYLWTIPSNLFPGYWYCVEIQDEFSYFFFIADYPSASITVSSPSSASWAAGTSHYINWTSSGGVQNVNIQLYSKWRLIQNITFNHPNTGFYNWSIPRTTSPGTNYLIKITATNSSDVFDYSTYFSIAPDPNPSITITSPSNSSRWVIGFGASISWWSTGAISYVNIELYRGSNFQQTIASGTYNDGYYYVMVYSSLFSAGSDYHIKISSNTSSNIYNYSDQFIISNLITITTPSSSVSWTMRSTQCIEWNSIYSSSYVTIELYKGSTLVETILDEADSSGSYYWTIPSSLSTGTNYRIKISSSSYGLYTYSDYFSIVAPNAFDSPWLLALITIGVVSVSVITGLGVIRHYSGRSRINNSYKNRPVLSPPKRIINESQSLGSKYHKYQYPSTRTIAPHIRNFDYFCLRCGHLIRANNRCINC